MNEEAVVDVNNPKEAVPATSKSPVKVKLANSVVRPSLIVRA